MRIKAILTVGLVGLLAACGTAGASSSGSDKKYEAFDVCTQFVKKRLKSPGSATFRDPTADNGDTVMTPSSDGSVYVITSSVDSENGFGASIRSTFTCAVKSAGGSLDAGEPRPRRGRDGNVQRRHRTVAQDVGEEPGANHRLGGPGRHRDSF
jgi:hypothetical protein